MSDMKTPKNKYPMSGKIEYEYNYNPKTTIVINYFTSVDTMIKTIERLRTLGDEVEIIVNNDRFGQDTEKIMKSLTHRNDRMIIAKDLAERRGYHHGAQISNASDYIIFCQDDDLAPDNNKWYLDCLKEFENDPKLGMIGLLKGGWNYSQPGKVTITDEYHKVYVSWLATGPLMIRKDLYFKIGSWSNEFSQIGEADGGADADIATKVLLHGYKSMLLRTPAVKEWYRRFERGDGMTNNSIKKNPTDARIMTNKRIILNNQIYFEKYQHNWNEIYQTVKKHNAEIGIKI
jgi:hypothetical protein|uniref:Glycosyltransferase 2-like domain-containing protein n=1 Tax=viral metagenome TaxID=1070528 RepID=A0A6C0IV66_9ZZZZ